MSHEASGLKQDRKKVEKRALFMASGTLTSRILGLFRDIALAALFDRSITDAWTAAFRLPNLFRRLLGEGSLSVSFIPVFIQAQEEDNSGVRARNLVNALYTFFLIFMGSLTVFGVIYMQPLLRLFLSAEYIHQELKWQMTVRMAQIMFGFVYFICTYAFLMGILNALGSFALPALAPALLNISMLLFTFLPGKWFLHPGDGLAWGVLVGGLLQSAVLWWALKRRGYVPGISWNMFQSDDVRHVLLNMIPGIVGIGLLQFSTLVNLYYSSGLQEGAISYIYWADRLLEFPLSLISVSIGAALLPTLSELAYQKYHSRFQEILEQNISLSIFLSLPASLGLFFLAEPIVEILFKRGHFTGLDVNGTTTVLQIYSLSMLFASGIRILSPAFYALKNTWVPACTSLLALMLHIYCASLWIGPWGLRGLVFSSLLAMAMQFVMLVRALSFFKIYLNWLKILKDFTKIVTSGSGLALITLCYRPLLNVFAQGPDGVDLPLRLLCLAVIVISAAMFYILSTYTLKLEAACSFVAFLKAKIERNVL